MKIDAAYTQKALDLAQELTKVNPELASMVADILEGLTAELAMADIEIAALKAQLSGRFHNPSEKN